MDNNKMKKTKEHIDPRMERKRKQLQMRRIRAGILVIEVIIFLALVGVACVLHKYSKFQSVDIEETQIEVNEGVKKEGYTTIALFGGDSREGVLEQGTHADCIIVASINNDTLDVNLASVYRDTLTEQIDGELKKVNNAYFLGGPQDAINVLNRNFDLDIQDYVTVDFKALTNTVDLLGGIELTISEEEMGEMNKYINETAHVAGVDPVLITETGIQLVDGAQAVTYARIRKISGGDFKRTERQRIVIEQTMAKALGTNIKTLNKIINTVFPQVSTSLTLKEIIELAANGMSYSIVDTTGFPFEIQNLNMEGIGSAEVPVGLTTNVTELHKVLYPGELYTPSSKVMQINDDIVATTGIDEKQE